jgi:hypothetical protein
MGVRNSALHNDLWDDVVRRRLGIDNATRWSSWCHVIDKAIEKQQKINQFILDYHVDLEDNGLSGRVSLP